MHVYQPDSDFPHFLPHDPLNSWPNSTTGTQEHPAPLPEDFSQTRTLVLPWSEQLQAAHQAQSLASALPDPQAPVFPRPASPTDQWSSDPLHWQQLLHYSYQLQEQIDTHPIDRLTQSTLPHLPLLTNLTLPIPFPLSDSTSAPQSASYSSGSPLSYASPFSFPPSPLSIAPSATSQFPDHAQRYVHPSDLSAPLPSPTGPSSLTDWNKETTTTSIPATDHLPTVQDTNINVSQLIPSETHLPAPTTRSRHINRLLARSPPSGSTSDTHTSDRAPATNLRSSRRGTLRYRGEKRKRTPSGKSPSNPARRTRGTQNNRSVTKRQSRSRKPSANRRNRAHTASETSDKQSRGANGEDGDGDGGDNVQEDGYDDDLEDSDDYQDDEGDDDDSYSYSNSSYSPSSSPPPLPTDVDADIAYAATTTGPPKSRSRRKAIGSLPLPVPVPNLTKKSRGRKVPSVAVVADVGDPNGESSHSGGSTSIASLGQRGYMCRIPGCGKCFVRGEHLKRHVRSIHTYEKRKSPISSVRRSIADMRCAAEQRMCAPAKAATRRSVDGITLLNTSVSTADCAVSFFFTFCLHRSQLSSIHPIIIYTLNLPGLVCYHHIL